MNIILRELNLFVYTRMEIIYHHLLRAEGDVIISTRRASEGASIIIFRITVGLWALSLEKLGIAGRRAVVDVVPRAAVLRGVQSDTSTVASIIDFQICRAGGSYVAAAARCRAASVRGSYGEREIEAINERDVIGILTVGTVQSIFSERCRRLSRNLTAEQTATVTSVAAALTGCVEGAACTPPESARACSCKDLNAPCFALCQRLTATYRNSRRPHRERTLVLDHKCRTSNSYG